MMSFDPVLFWPPTVVDFIFQHLNGKEILESSLVSTTWEDHIASSPTCMGKITLKIIGRKYLLDGRDNELKAELEMLSASRRRYENFILYAQKPGCLTSAVIDLLNSRQGKWKNVKIWSEKFKDENQFEILLKAIAGNVETVDLRNISFLQSLNNFEPRHDLSFPKLKQLSLCNVKSFVRLTQSFASSKSLKFLEIENGLEEFLDNFPKNFSSVTSLSIVEDKWRDDLFVKLSAFPLKLENLKINIQCCDCPDSQAGLVKLLNVQAMSISKLVVDMKVNVAVVKSIFELPKLKELHFMTPIDYADDLPISRSIIKLELNFDCNQDFLSSLLAATPNRQSLKIMNATPIKSTN